ncbi:MAG: ABC transporter ATP-binding protein [Albidovulum sp.]|nr:ABC transporter ATP-binding protein [Albidovulum sp.]
MARPVLAVRHLSVDFRTLRGRVHALRDVSLEVPPNKIVGVLGESGCGKSTLINAVTGLLANNAEITRGEVIFEQADLAKLSERELLKVRGEKISMVFQDPMTAQNPVISVGRQMTDTLYRHRKLSAGEKRKLATGMLRKVGISDPEERMDQFPHEFSGGMRQRISIAMALMMNPDLFIADEPTTALDVTMEAQFIHLLRELQADIGCAVLFISHNLGLIAELCDEVVVMYAGEVVEKGPLAEIFFNPCHHYTRRLIECDPSRVLDRSAVLPTIPGRLPNLTRLPAGCIFRSRCGHAIAECATKSPPLLAVSETHSVACFNHASLIERPAGGRAPRLKSNASENPVLEVDGVHVRYPTGGLIRRLLRPDAPRHMDAVIDVGLKVAEGQTFGLAGESGSGKSSLGRAIMGLTPAKDGSIRFKGDEIRGLPPREFKRYRRAMAMMFQDPVASLSPRQKVRRLVMEPFEIHGADGRDLNREAENLFQMVGLSREFFDRYAHELSGGQARRVGVARALALRPALIIADEPTAGLDVSVQGEILNLLRELQRELGLTYIVISHNLPVLRHVSDRVGIMYLGRIVEQGPTDRIFSRPAHPYTRALLDGIPRPDPSMRRKLESIEGEIPSITNRPPGCEFHPRCPIASDLCRAVPPAATELNQDHVVHCHNPLQGA